MTITLTREEAQQVLDALVLAQWVSDKLQNQVVFFEAEETLRARLAQPEPEPQWKGLSTAETKALWNATKKPTAFAYLLQAALKEKNERDA